MGQNFSDCKTKMSDLYDDTVNTIKACVKVDNSILHGLYTYFKETNIDNQDFEEGNNVRKDDYYAEDNNERQN